MKPQQFRTKPVVIEAIRWDGTAEGATPIIDWTLGAENDAVARYHEGFENDGGRRPSQPACIAIDTLEGTMLALPGDWIIRGVQGEFYPCKPGIFAATYEAVESETV